MSVFRTLRVPALQRCVPRRFSSEVKPLEGVLVLAFEQAMAAPFATSRLAEAGARVIKVERDDGKGDFNRGYDNFLGKGDSAHSMWLNRGKESLTVDIKDENDKAMLHRILEETDVFVQNFAPGAAARSGFGAEELRKKYPKLVTCDCSGYGNEADAGSYWDMKAYDMLVQAESGISVLAGQPGRPTRCGVSVADIALGMYSHAAILEGLMQARQTGIGCSIDASLFGCLADWLTVSLFHFEADGQGPAIGHGLRHPAIQPYRDYKTRGDPLLISIQNEREFKTFCNGVLEKPELLKDVRFTSNVARCQNSDALDREIEDVFTKLDRDALIERLRKERIAYGQVNGMRGLSEHPALTRVPVELPDGTTANSIAAPPRFNGKPRKQGKVPAYDQHSAEIRAEFSEEACAKRRGSSAMKASAVSQPDSSRSSEQLIEEAFHISSAKGAESGSATRA